MIDHGLLLKDVRRALLAWPGGRSIREYDEPNGLDTTPLVAAADLLADVPRAQELFALAETAQWSRAAADELIDLIDDWRLANASAIDAWHDEKARAAGAQAAQQEAQQKKAAADSDRAMKAAASRLENQRAKKDLPLLQHRVKVAERDLDVLFDPEKPDQMQLCMNFFAAKGWALHRPDNVKTAIRKLRAKGL